ncbi:U-box domain-containing protein 26-like [Mercurialis annua]|uniref:U-box domain-containing protein 26-like n=1 Tax=Mercurialis annua TaxID=3986 RepID=UPI00216000F1|nr:U-box domain-containing protein 26-like [Mercurialis annua]
MSIPQLFICPISLDLFKDPVTLCTGQTYDRSSIEKWVAAGNLTCPVTMQKLHDLSMVPNHTLRHLIHDWLQPQLGIHRLSINDSLASLKHQLQSHDSTLHDKYETLQRTRALSEESTSRILCLVHSGFFPLLLELLFQEIAPQISQESIEFAEQSLCCALKLLPFAEHKSLNILRQESKLESFKILLEFGTSKIKVGLCHLIEAISSSLDTRELCLMLGRNRGLLRILVQLVEDKFGGGINAISALCSLETNREIMVEEGVVNGLVSYICNGEDLAGSAMATIEVLLGVESGKEAVIEDGNGIRGIVKMVFRVSDHQSSESAVRSLIILCSHSLQAREEAICAGVLTQLLLLLQSQCSCTTKSKARLLLQLLRSNCNQ